MTSDQVLNCSAGKNSHFNLVSFMLSGVFEHLILPLNLLEKPCQKNFKSHIQIFQSRLICIFVFLKSCSEQGSSYLNLLVQESI